MPTLNEALDDAVTRLQQSVLASDAAETDQARSRAALIHGCRRHPRRRDVGARQAREEGRAACDELVSVLGRLRTARFSE